MSLGDILSKSLSYPLSDLKNFLIVGIFTMLASLATVCDAIFGPNSGISFVGAIIGIIFALIIAGYSITVIKKAMNRSNEIPSFDFVNNFVDGIKVLVIAIVYLFIPLIITFALLVMFGLVGAGFNNIAASLGIWSFLAIILFILFGIFEVIAEARFAESGSIGYALSIGQVFEDVKRIGIIKIILFLIISIILMFIVSFIIGLLAIIPVIGVIIANIILGGYFTLFYGYAIGLLYLE